MDKQHDLVSQDELIGLIYEAVLSPALWPELLFKMNQYIDAIPTESDLEVQSLADDDVHNTLQSHFKRAVKIQRRMSNIEGVSNALVHVLNHLSVGVVLVRRDAKVVVCNDLAKVMLKEMLPLSIQNGKLHAGKSAQTRQLLALIKHSFLPAPIEPDDFKMLSLGLQKDSATVWVTSGLTEMHAALPHQEELAAVFMVPEKKKKMSSLRRFFQQFKISAAESRLVETLIYDCHTLNDAADKLHISKHTARAQMKSALSKSNCNSQMELVKKVLISPSAMVSKPIQVFRGHHEGVNHSKYREMRLFDGRKLVWKEFGDPQGEPVLVFHSLTGMHPDYQGANAKRVRLIIPERPGAHGSDSLAGRKIIDWADDIQQLTDHLNLETFSILGYSAGGPYALACLQQMPQRIQSVALVSSMAPIRSEDDLQGMLPLNHTVLRLAYESPKLMSDFMKVVLDELEDNPESYFENVSGYQPLSDTLFLSEGKVQAQFNQAFQAAAKDNFQQLCDEIVLLASDWSLNTSDYQGKVSIWHGFKDPLVPIGMGKRIASIFSQADAHFFEDEGNYLVYTHWGTILDELIHTG